MAATAEPTTGIHEVPIDQIVPGKNVRPLDKDHVDSLTLSIKTRGILVPLLVAAVDDGWGLIGGYHRYAAAKKAGLDTVPILVRDDADGVDFDPDADAAIENISRRQLRPTEEAEAIKRMMDRGLTEQGAADALGVSIQRVQQRLLIFKLPKEAQKLVHDGSVPPGAVRSLVKLADYDKDIALAVSRYIAGDPARGLKAGRDPDAVIVSAIGDGYAMRDIKPAFWRHSLGNRISPQTLGLEPGKPWPVPEPLTDKDREKMGFGKPGEDEEQDDDWAAEVKERADEIEFAKEHNAEVEQAASYQDLLDLFVAIPHESYRDFGEVVLDGQDADAARAAGVLLEIGERAKWITSREWLIEHLRATLPGYVERLREQADEKKAATRKAGAKGAQAVLAGNQSTSQLASTLEGRMERDLAPEVRAANQDLHAVALNRLSKVKPDDKDVALFMVRTILGMPNFARASMHSTYDTPGSWSPRLAQAWRVCDPACVEVTIPQLKGGREGKPKVKFLETVEAEKLMWKYIEGGKTAGEIYGRLLACFAIYEHAETTGLGNPQRFYRAGVASNGDVAKKALAKILKGIAPKTIASVKRKASGFRAKAQKDAEAQVAAAREAAAAAQDDATDEGDAATSEEG